MIEIREGEIERAFDVSLQIPEFVAPYSHDKWKDRLDGKDIICLTAYAGTVLAGLKVGYFEDDAFYSWVGGVLPAHRRIGVAKALAERLESILRNRGCHYLRMKTHNRFRAMLLFAISNGFHVVDIYRKSPADKTDDIRIVLEKKI